MSDAEEQSEDAPEAPLPLSDPDSPFNRHTTIFDEGRTFAPPGWYNHTLEEYQVIRSGWIAERKMIEKGLEEAQFEHLGLMVIFPIKTAASEKLLDEIERIVYWLKACRANADKQIKYFEDVIGWARRKEGSASE